MFLRASSLTLLLTSSAFSQSSRIQGVVNDDAGKNPSGVYVVATTQSPTDHHTYSALTGPNGAYTIGNLPSGKYTLCLQAPGGSHLNNCQYAMPIQVTVAASQTVTQNISVSGGGIFQLRLADPNRLSTPTDDILLGVYLPTGLFHPMRFECLGGLQQ